MTPLTTLRTRVRKVRNDGGDRLWELGTVTFEQLDQWLDARERLPVGPIARLVERRLAALTEVPVDGWDELNAKQAVAAVRELDRTGLRKARRREATTKNRKTVLAAIEAKVAA
jgi:hypothetical protein